MPAKSEVVCAGHIPYPKLQDDSAHSLPQQIVSSNEEAERNSDEETLSDASDDKPISSLKTVDLVGNDADSEGEDNKNNQHPFVRLNNDDGSVQFMPEE